LGFFARNRKGGISSRATFIRVWEAYFRASWSCCSPLKLSIRAWYGWTAGGMIRVDSSWAVRMSRSFEKWDDRPRQSQM
jgi:hypothetical protein